MLQKNLHQAELAYISPCHAADNRDLDLLDEGVHMAGACQLAGFPTVIGTLWHIEDAQSASIAESGYRAMLTEQGNLESQKSARCLHMAIRRIRENSWK